ncbi:unnamed protein product [Toxocara canis]|uniref:SH2 domain-containing protein n=1 Tax=Toxocara canis TaxID=6265 RepID=A0A183UH43_TOXCA|nr:unnamed protein product [Toxocara canis]
MVADGCEKKRAEWVYPVDDVLERQLDQVAYFCKNASRNKVLKALLTQPEGSFVLRSSESKKKFLALSVRVPFTHNPTGVAHYLIVRNEHGFKINGFNKYFPSIPMLVTHHSVMPERLPCRLIFARWDNTWKCEHNNYDYPPSEGYE